MNEMTKACIRGCAMYRQHLSDCEDQDECRGCLPRRAEHGNLCWPCHRRLELMLTDAPVVHRWLTGNLGAGQGAARAKEDHERGSSDGSPAPIKVMVYDQRQLLADRLAVWSDDLAETKGVSAPERHSVEADAKFLLRWLPGIERLDWIGDWWEELAETLSDAHSLAPWRPEVKRCRGVPCPECGEVNLLIFGGEEDATCGSCRFIIPAKRFALWEQIIRDEKAAS
jgi:hypothetical protein